MMIGMSTVQLIKWTSAIVAVLLIISASYAQEEERVDDDESLSSRSIAVDRHLKTLLRDRLIRKLMIEEMVSDWNSFGFDDEEQRRPGIRRRGERRGGVGEMMGSSLGGLTSAWLGEWSSFLGGLTGGLGRGRGDDDQVTSNGVLPGETCMCNRRCNCAAQCKRFAGAMKKACVQKCTAVGVCPG